MALTAGWDCRLKSAVCAKAGVTEATRREAALDAKRGRADLNMSSPGNFKHTG
jgi:hypothetical protein